MSRPTSWATPGYSLFCHDTTANGKNKDFSVCGHSCGQSRFCAAFGNRGKSRKRRRCKALRRFALTLSRIPPRHSQSRRTASIRRHRIIKAAAPLCGIAIKIPREIQRGICCLIGRQTAETLPDRLPLRRHRRGGPRRCGRVHRANRPSASCPDCGWSAWC